MKVPRACAHGGLRFTITNYNPLAQIEAMLVELKRVWLELSAETGLEIDLTGGPRYEAGDALGVIPFNDRGLVDLY